MQSLYGQGDITARAQDTIPFGAFVYRSASGRVKPTLSGLSAVFNNTEPVLLGVALSDNIEDENNPGFYTSNDEIPVAASPGRQVNVLVRGNTTQVQLGDMLYPNAQSHLKTGKLGIIRMATLSAALSNVTDETLNVRSYAVAKALEELETSANYYGNVKHAVSGAANTNTLSFNSSGFSALGVKAGDYIINGSAGNWQLNRVKKTAGYVVTTQDTITKSQAVTTPVYKLVPLRAVLL